MPRQCCIHIDKSSQLVFSLWATNNSLISKRAKKGHSDIQHSQQKQPLNCIHSAKCFSRIIWSECQESLPKKLLFLFGLLRLDYTGLFCSPNPAWPRGSALGEAPWAEKGSAVSHWTVPGPSCAPRAALTGNIPGTHPGKHGEKKAPRIRNRENWMCSEQQLPLCSAPGAGEEGIVPLMQKGPWVEQNKPCRNSPTWGQSSGWPLLCSPRSLSLCQEIQTPTRVKEAHPGLCRAEYLTNYKQLFIITYIYNYKCHYTDVITNACCNCNANVWLLQWLSCTEMFCPCRALGLCVLSTLWHLPTPPTFISSCSDRLELPCQHLGVLLSVREMTLPKVTSFPAHCCPNPWMQPHTPATSHWGLFVFLGSFSESHPSGFYNRINWHNSSFSQEGNQTPQAEEQPWQHRGGRSKTPKITAKRFCWELQTPWLWGSAENITDHWIFLFWGELQKNLITVRTNVKMPHSGWHKICLFSQSSSETTTYGNQYFPIDFHLKAEIEWSEKSVQSYLTPPLGSSLDHFWSKPCVTQVWTWLLSHPVTPC